MLNFRLPLLFLFLILSVLCDENNILDEVKREQNYIETYYIGCSKIKGNVTPKDCAIATLEWDFKCCYVAFGDTKECRYLKDDKKWIKKYKAALNADDADIRCSSFIIKFRLFFIFTFLIIF